MTARQSSPKDWRDLSYRRKGVKLPVPLHQDLARQAHNLFVSKNNIFEQDDSPRRGRHAKWATLQNDSGVSLEDYNRNSSFFPPSRSAESLAILKACLGTNLVSRAIGIFNELRGDAAQSIEQSDTMISGPPSPELRHKWQRLNPMPRSVYNGIISAMLRRAAAESDSYVVHTWVDPVWRLFRDMEAGFKTQESSSFSAAVSSERPTFVADPEPDEATVAILARGLVNITQKHSDISIDDLPLGELVHSSYRLGLSFDGILSASPSVIDYRSGGEIDPALLAHRLIVAATSAGNDAARRSLETAQRKLQDSGATSQTSQLEVDERDSPTHPQDVEPLPELIPVRKQGAGAQATTPDGEAAKPLNLDLLRKDLSIIEQARSVSADNETRQRWLEESSLESARQKIRAVAEDLEKAGVRTDSRLSTDGQLQAWMWDWVQKLSKVLKSETARIVGVAEGKQPTGRGRPKVEASFETTVAPFLRLVSAEKMALVTVMELMRMCGTGGVTDGMKTARTLITVGSAIEAEHYVDVLRRNPQKYAQARRAHEMVRNKGLADVQLRLEAKKFLESQDEGELQWTQNIRARVGSFLVGHLLQVATVRREATDRDGEVWSEDHPAFYSTYQYLQGKKLGVIKANDVVAERMDKDTVGETIHPRQLPMLIKPRLWLTHDEGGYLMTKSSMMRYKESAEQASYLRAASESGNQLETVMSALDSLGETAWNINTPVLKVMLEVWNSGKELGKMPPLIDENHGRPVRPDDYDSNLMARRTYDRAEKVARFERAALHSRRCDVNYRLEIARAFAHETFYLPHNLDFRGRAYPIPPHLHHMGDDISRGVMLFAKGKKLGMAGLRWLRIHLANVYGYDKASFDERIQFAKDHMADVEDAVKHPLDGSLWWQKADDPWQCLATCHELWAAVNHPEGPSEFVSHMPVHQDGTCNGLQHYAALGGDLAGAKQVNLAGGDRPADVYTAVADLVIGDIEREAQSENPDPACALLKGKITRKVVKQTVMTTVYGVTFIGAKDQVMRQLIDRGDIPREEVWRCAVFLSRKILASIGDLFAGAQQIQHWLSESASLISRSFPQQRLEHVMGGSDRVMPKATTKADRLLLEQMTSVIWTSPIGLPIVQPYRKVKKTQIQTAFQSVFLRDPKATSEVSPSKQASAFPPNFIHSLDATHMLLTALECQDAGLTFASVHDSYWTHACDVETMSEIIRDTFVRLHSQPILPKLREEFLERYEGHLVPILAAERSLAKRAHQMARSALAKTRSAELTGTTVTDNMILDAVQAKKILAGEAEIESADKMSKKATKGSSQEDEAQESVDEEDAAMEDDEDDETYKASSAAGGRKAKYVAGYVPLSEILPPIPEKGNFDVNRIRDSKYFFS
ncbi:unnamed protein product [Jaminaea pallidilutea]